MTATMSTPATAEVPEPGQVVEVRGSTWAVTDVQEQGITRSPADETIAGLQHVVSLQALGEDNLGDELRVIWELEVGNTLAPDQGLPERINADDLRRTLAEFDATEPLEQLCQQLLAAPGARDDTTVFTVRTSGTWPSDSQTTPTEPHDEPATDVS